MEAEWFNLGKGAKELKLGSGHGVWSRGLLAVHVLAFLVLSVASLFSAKNTQTKTKNMLKSSNSDKRWIL